MDFKTIQSVIIQTKEICDYIYLHVLGEPLLHPDFEKILNLLDECGMKLQLVTNGTLLSKYPNILNHKCLRKLSISLHSVSNLDIANSYFDTISDLIENNSYTIIELRFFEENYLSEDLLNYRRKLMEKYGTSETNMRNCLKLKNNVYLATSSFFEWPNINSQTISVNGYCHGGKDMLAILNNGDVTLCCLDPKGHNAIGNINSSSLIDILKSDEYQKYLSNLNNRKLIKELCTKCSYRLRFDGRKN